MLLDLQPTNSQTERIELLLFQSGEQLFATRTPGIKSLWRGQLSYKETETGPQRSILSPRLGRAFVGWARLTPVFRLDALLDLAMQSASPTQIILLDNYTEVIGLAVEQVFEVRRFELAQLELLPPLITLIRERDSAWVLLSLDETLKFQGADILDSTSGRAGQLVIVVDFAQLFDQTEQNELKTWLHQTKLEQGGTQ